MIFTRSSRKPTEKVSSDNAALSFDLLSNLTYMSALSTGEAPRDVIFDHAIAQPYKTAIYFKQVYLLAKRLGFEYGRSFQLVSKKAGAETVRSLLLRFAGSISSGESEHQFLAQEARVERDQYISGYQRSLETLLKWTDAYAALMVSTSLIVVVAMISTMLYDIGTSFVFLLIGTMFIMSFFGAYIIYKAAPYEIKTYKNRLGPKNRRRAMLLFVTLGPVGILAAVYLGQTYGAGLAFLALSICLLPAGVYAFLDDSKVTKIDQELAPFLRSVGNVADSLGTTLTAAMARIDRRSLETLEPYIKRLQGRLRSQISPKVCWNRFKDETGSELVSRATTMFVDGTGLGGSPERVGQISADYSMDIALLRAKRHVTALPFAYLCVPLHGAMSALLIFVLGVMTAFNGKLLVATEELGAGASVLPALPVFQTRDMSLISMLTLGAVIVLTIANTLAAKFATGGHSLMLAFYGSIMCCLSAVNLLLIPPISQAVLS